MQITSGGDWTCFVEAACSLASTPAAPAAQAAPASNPSLILEDVNLEAQNRAIGHPESQPSSKEVLTMLGCWMLGRCLEPSFRIFRGPRPWSGRLLPPTPSDAIDPALHPGAMLQAPAQHASRSCGPHFALHDACAQDPFPGKLGHRGLESLPKTNSVFSLNPVLLHCCCYCRGSFAIGGQRWLGLDPAWTGKRLPWSDNTAKKHMF